MPQPIVLLVDHNPASHAVRARDRSAPVFDGDAAVDLVAGSREAAKWLAAMHRLRLTQVSGFGLGVAEAFRTVANRRSRPWRFARKSSTPFAADEHVEKRIAEAAVELRRFVFTHGRYHHDQYS